MGRTWTPLVAVWAVLWLGIQGICGSLAYDGWNRALLQAESSGNLEMEDTLDELDSPEAEAPAPEPVEKLCAEPRVFLLEAVFNWTAARHPMEYPENASWSPMFGVVHNEGYELFSYEKNASKAVEQIAEEGKGTLLKEEVEQCIDEGNCREFLEYSCDEKAGNCKMTGNFTVNTTFSMVSLIAMARPSPDWFTGVSSLDMCNNGAWLTDLDLRLNASDAGTDAGKTFTSRNRNIPVGKRGLIMEFDELSLENPFYNPDFVPMEFDEEGNEVPIEDAPPGGLEEVVHMTLQQDKETVDEDLGGGSDAVTVEEIDRTELTDEELKALEEKEASIRFIGPRNGCRSATDHIISVTFLVSLATMMFLF